jgi:hypothetical protein
MNRACFVCLFLCLTKIFLLSQSNVVPLIHQSAGAVAPISPSQADGVRVEDGGARYSAAVDPWIQQAELTASDGAARDGFGWSVAVSGSTLVVGGYDSTIGRGAAYVFVRSGETWSQQAELTASDGNAGYFGWSVAVSGSTVAVGAGGPEEDVPGAAFVFVQSAGTWSQQAELTASDGAAGDEFGRSVAVSGSTVVVGAPFAGSNNPQGAAYIFAQSGGRWTQQAELTASDGPVYWFGISVAISGSTVVVGIIEGNDERGAAYVFVQSAGTWSQEAELTASDGVPYNSFGWSVAASGSTIAVGAPSNIGGFTIQPGEAYVFGETGGIWSQEQELSASDGAADDYFGWSVAASGRTVVAGAQCHFTSSGECDPGAAYVFGSSGPAYTLLVAPSSLSVMQGGQGTSTIAITPWNGFSGNVSLSASNLPNGVMAAFNPNPATSTSTLTLTASETGTTGALDPVIVAGTSGGLAQATRLTLSVTTSITLSPAPLSFGNEDVDITSVAKRVTLQNTGTGTLTISGITISGNFAISKNKCGPPLKAGKKCFVDVTFTPSQPGVATGTLTFTDSAASSPQTVALSGTGIAQAALTPSSLTLAETEVGDTSDAEKVTLTNNLRIPLTGISYSTTGPFAVSTSTCPATLNANKDCTISVTFSPTQAGPATGTLTVTDSANNSPQTVSLSGTGTTAAVYVSPTSVDFGNQSVGTTSGPQNVDLFNKGSQPITVTSVSTSGNFAVTENYCMNGVKPNTHCYVEVVFSPTQSGPLSGTLTFVDSATGSPQTASLSGTGD